MATLYEEEMDIDLLAEMLDGQKAVDRERDSARAASAVSIFVASGLLVHAYSADNMVTALAAVALSVARLCVSFDAYKVNQINTQILLICQLQQLNRSTKGCNSND